MHERYNLSRVTRMADWAVKVIGALIIAATQARAQTITIDARPQPSPPETTYLHMGANTSPSGHTIGVNSRYLTKDGKPYLPVMGEFHYSRYPENEWDTELAKMKAAGVDIVASYVIWIHHEEEKGVFDWSGQRNLRKFVELAQKNGLYVFPRIGPWSHAEVRRGGFPDWLVNEVGDRLRSNDSTYLHYTDRFYNQIFQQVKGLLWKDGGSIIGIQLENEYNPRGPGRGEEHILTLKRLAVNAGFDVPLYTVTGWDNAVLPSREVLPVFGGYPDMPWDQSIEELPPSEVYAFRFENRWAGNMGAQGPRQEPHPTSQAALVHYPFLGAEYGGGIQITYHRRPVISSDDVAAMLPVQIGSGVNLYGYYMFHGGTNPEGKFTTLMESQRTGYPTDVPVKSYDFQTLLSEFGEVRPSLRKVKLMHYFLNAYGYRLAPMVVRRPDRVPANSADTTTLRVSARTLGDEGFIFFNNYLRNYSMPVRRNAQISLQLPSGTVRVPEMPIDIPSGAYGVWPVNLPMFGTRLIYSTAQLITRQTEQHLETVYFMTIPGIKPEFVFDSATVQVIIAPGATVTRGGGVVRFRDLRTGTNPAIVLRTNTSSALQIVLLSADDASNMWHIKDADHDRVVFIRDPMRAAPIKVPFTLVKAATTIPRVPKFNAVTWRKVEIALAPSDSAWVNAARYRIEVPRSVVDTVAEMFLEIRYTGDAARLYSGDQLLADNFYNGTPWRVGLKRFADAIRRGPLELRILPLRSDAPIYIPESHRPTSYKKNGQRAELDALTVIRGYEVKLNQ